MRMTLNRRKMAALAGMMTIGLLIAFAADHLLFTSSRGFDTDTETYRDTFGKYDTSASEHGIVETPFYMAPQIVPELVPALQVDLGDKEKVIAIVVDGRHFAYPLFNLTSIGEHIVNDSIGGTPITVIYCSQTDCVRVLTTDKTDQPLRVMQQGLVNSELALYFAGTIHQLSKDTIPLDPYDYEIVSWPAWRDEHPKGLVFPGINWEKFMEERPDP